MSVTALNWAYQQHCPSGVAKSVLVYLANCASKGGGDCWPSVPNIVLAVQHTERAVRHALVSLVESGLLTIEQRFRLDSPRSRTSNCYHLPVVSIAPSSRETSPDLPAESPPPPLRERPHPPCDSAPTLPAFQQGNPSLNQEREPSIEPKEEAPRVRSAFVADLFTTDRELPPEPIDPIPEPAVGSDDDPAFAGFWAAYPRKDDKGHARKAWIKARAKALGEEIVIGCQGYRFDDNPRFVPLPATWLNGERWLAAAEADTFDPVLRAVGLTPEDFANRSTADLMAMLQ
jgi:hypothetical protein